LVSEWTLNVDATHSESLLWGIHRILEGARWQIGDVDLFGVGVGPGSFTGLRIGLTTARTLAHSLGKPLIGVSSLAALARPAAQVLVQPTRAGRGVSKSRVILIAATDAAKGELFSLFGNAKSVLDCVARAEGDFPGLWKRGVEEDVLAPDDLIRAVKRKLLEGVKGDKEAHWAVVGEAKDRYPDIWKKLPKSKQIEVPLSFCNTVQGRSLGQLVWEAYQAGIVRPALSVHPRYLRASDAEIKLRSGLLPPGPTRNS
jgi:tRNA threonylcarbamoyl adenosine modification protein YeaZ